MCGSVEERKKKRKISVTVRFVSNFSVQFSKLGTLNQFLNNEVTFIKEGLVVTGGLMVQVNSKMFEVRETRKPCKVWLLVLERIFGEET